MGISSEYAGFRIGAGFALAGMMMLLVVLPQPTAADDWPQWRGPRRDGMWREQGLVDRFAGERLKLRWRREISGGYSGPTVAEGRVYVSDRIVVGEQQLERVHCFDALTGQAVWLEQYDCSYVNVSYGGGPRGSVTICDGLAYSLGTMGHLVCLDAAFGIVHWRRDLNAEYKIRMPMWGITCSPLVEGDHLIVQIGGADGSCIVALDRISGELRWRALDDPASYSSPIVIDQAGHRVLVCWTGQRVVGLSPTTGQLYWEYSLPPKKWIRASASPVWHGDRLLVSGFFVGSHMLRLDSEKLAVERLWHRVGSSELDTDGLHVSIAEPLIQNGLVFGVDSFGQLRCLDADTGERNWENLKVIPQQRWSTLRLIPQGDRIWLFTELGELAIGRISRRGYEEISRAQLIRPTRLQLPSRRAGVCWAHPAFAGRHIYARNDEELVCASLEASE